MDNLKSLKGVKQNRKCVIVRTDSGILLVQTSQPQNTEIIRLMLKKSGDFSKNLEIDRPADKTK